MMVILKMEMGVQQFVKLNRPNVEMGYGTKME